MIPYGRQSISKKDIQAVVDILESDYLTQGPVVPLFEKAIASFVNAREGVAVNSGTSALHIACLALGLKQGDYLWTTPITFVASANCGLYCGASIDFVDIDSETFNMSVTNLQRKLEFAAQNGTLPKVLVVVHFAGLSCDMQEISRLAKRYKIYIIEDACHAIGGSYRGELIGSCRYSDITVFSFHPVKIITTTEGGMAVTKSPELAEKMRLIRSHGVTRDVDKMAHKSVGDWYYQQVELGFNYRMTDLQAALGLSQLQNISTFISKRKQIATNYASLLPELLITPQKGELFESAWHLYVIRIQTNSINQTHQQVFSALRSAGIGVNLHYIPVHTQPYYQQFGFSDNDFPQAMHYYHQAISLPIYPDLTKQQQLKVVNELEKILNL